MPRKKKFNLPLLEVVLISLALHVAALFVLGGITIWQTFAPKAEIVAEAPPSSEPPPPPPKVRIDKSMKDSAKPTKVVSVNITPDMNLPELDVDVPVTNGKVAVGGGGFGGAGRGLGGLDFAKTNIPFFGIEDGGDRIVFILDYSGSMNDEVPTGEKRIQLLREQMAATINEMPDQIFGEIIFFSGPSWVMGETHNDVKDQYNINQGTPQWWLKVKPKNLKNISDPEWKRMRTSTKREMIAAVNNNKLSGGTVWSNPIHIARKLDPPPDVIFFLTDGATSDEVVQETYKLVTDWRNEHRELRINTIALGDAKAAEGMAQIARRTGGEFRLINSKKDIQQLAQN